MNENNYNPVGNPRIRPVGPSKVVPPKPEVEKRQDPKHTSAEFARDLTKATRRVKRA